MTDKQTQSGRNPGRKPQINLEVTDDEKVFFLQLAEARGIKLAALVRELLNAEGARLGIPALLESYKSDNGRYQYIIKRNENVETKLGIFRQFLLAFKHDCDFSITSFEVNTYIPNVQCTAFSSSGENSNTVYIELSQDRETNYEERREIDRVWQAVLGLSLNLADKWNGVNYLVEARRTLKGKKIILKQFVEKYRSYKLDINDSFNGGAVFKVTASNEHEKVALLIERLPQRAGEVAELRRELEEYQQLPE